MYWRCHHSLINLSCFRNQKKRVFFSETTDSSNTEQMSFVIRFIDYESSDAREKFLRIITCDSTNAGYLKSYWIAVFGYE